MKKIVLLQLITFLSAFLLFQIELIVAKMMLPDYGGSYMVWGACMVFFQATLLVGYYFSHMIMTRAGISKYLTVHLVLMVLPLLFFPGRELVLSGTRPTGFLSADVFQQLLFTIGPVFFLLSTMSMVTQVWLANSNLTEKNSPYTLYAWSNFGSFAALLTYPFIFEYFFDLSIQLLIWRISYIVLIGLNIAAWALVRTEQAEAANEAQKIQRLPNQGTLKVFMLSAGAVMIFLAVSNIIAVEIAPIPLIWIMPLGIYLLAFVLNFKQIPWYPEWIGKYIHGIIGLSILVFFMLEQQKMPVIAGVPAILALLFVTSMYCQRQVIALRPADHRQLTVFYLIISLGGFAGGFFTTWIVPLIWNLLLEYPLALFIIAINLTEPAGRVSGRNNNLKLIGFAVSFVAVIMFWPRVVQGDNFFMAILLSAATFIAFGYFKDIRYATAASVFLVIISSAFLEMAWTGRNPIYKVRNFYGIYQVYNTGRILRFRHGSTLHGTQVRDPQNPMNEVIPTTYYGYHSPVSPILSLPQVFPLKRIGVIGLGAGTLAVYTREGQTMDFYELDPEVVRIGVNYFSFIKNAGGSVNFITGDGRLNLKNRTNVKYDALIIDAFNGDVVPYHLISKEMIELCRQKLNPGGVLLYHLSNKYFKLDHVLSRIARDVNISACFKAGTNSGDNIEELSLWGALTWDKNVHEKLVARFGWTDANPGDYAGLRVWTDQYSSVLSVIK